ncbi:SusC/RagA family TonB-linked outer membrane protein [Adhaeribacter rhizoryzae]|uniref:TonB-dependent receptor n=1 Tax=Adhaeribacter rhizoryzae TaxID=2607907 RepID=A0A5M6D654_9BACT|nr:TonB-dependent receptor [Adhaeribacter rhizoryzae]KAA5542997.1 TonB-dependent receptor [Adhaeribacter rhizoryzae]
MKKLLQKSSKLLVLLALYQTASPAYAAKYSLNLTSKSISQPDDPTSTNANISGKVVTAAGEPLPGVTVIVKNTQNGTTTATDGTFQLSVAKPTEVLVFSFIGYTAKEVPLNNQKNIQVTLHDDVKALSEVVVVGYGTQERRNLVGSVTKVDAAETKDIPTGGFNAQLQGKVAGVQVSSNTGVPGEAVALRVRGATSINSSNEPLYVIDGVFLNSSSLQSIGTGGKATSPLADINPADILSVEVLKDASATAIYGSRGANGVIIVTTKRGDFNQKPKITFNASQGWSKAVKLWDLTTGPEHATLVNEYYTNIGKPKPFRPATEVINGVAGLGLPEEQQTYDRLGKVFGTARLQNYDLALQGGTANTKYYIAGGYNTQESILKPITFERASFKVNLDQVINDKWQVGVSNTFGRTFRNQARAGDGPAGGLLQAALHTPTYLAPTNEQGVPVGRAGFDNVDLLLENYDVHSVSLRYLGNLYLEGELLPNVRFRSSWGVDYNNYDESEYWNTYLISGSPAGAATAATGQQTALLNEQTLTFRKEIAPGHTLGVLLGNTLQSNVLSRTSATGTGFANNSFKLISAAAVSTSSQSWTKNTLTSFFSRVDYNYHNRYLLELTFRADGSSRFGNQNKWGYFPAIGAAWRAKQEKFLKDVNAISDLKLKVNYGITGNQNLPDFANQGLWAGGSPYQGQPGTAPQQLGNENLKWERTSQINAGLELGLLHDRLGLEVNVYHKYTKDGLLPTALPATTGFSTYWDNVAEVSNKGFELGINTENIKTAGFSWQTNFNISRNINRIEKLPTPLKYGSRDLIIQQEGHPLYSFWVYKQLYVDPQTGNAVYEDVDKNGSITTADRQIYGSIWPKYFGGITNNFSYRGFDANIFLAFSYGNKIYNHNRFFGEGGGARDAARIIFASNLNRWQQPGDITDVPKADGVNVNNYRDGGSRWLEDGSYLRLRAVNLGYTLPLNYARRFKMEAVRVYVVGSNLFTATKYTGLDPESAASSDQNQQGIDLGTPPQPRSIQVGVNLTL